MGRPRLNNPTRGVTIRLSIVAIAQLTTEAARKGTKLNALAREVLEAHAKEQVDK